MLEQASNNRHWSCFSKWFPFIICASYTDDDLGDNPDLNDFGVIFSRLLLSDYPNERLARPEHPNIRPCQQRFGAFLSSKKRPVKPGAHPTIAATWREKWISWTQHLISFLDADSLDLGENKNSPPNPPPDWHHSWCCKSLSNLENWNLQAICLSTWSFLQEETDWDSRFSVREAATLWNQKQLCQPFDHFASWTHLWPHFIHFLHFAQRPRWGATVPGTLQVETRFWLFNRSPKILVDWL